MDRETLLVSNRSLAEDSLTRRPRLCNGKFQLAKKYRELSNLAAACWEKQSQLGELTGWWFLDLEGSLSTGKVQIELLVLMMWSPGQICMRKEHLSCKLQAVRGFFPTAAVAASAVDPHKGKAELDHSRSL